MERRGTNKEEHTALIARLVATIVLVSGVAAQERDEPPVRVHAAASLADVLPRIAALYSERCGRSAPLIEIGASGRMVRQIEQGAPVDIVITADAEWMDVLTSGGRLLDHTRRPLIANRLVMIVPVGAAGEHEVPHRLAVAAEGVPAGRRAREVIAGEFFPEVLGPEDLVSAPDVRAALALVARGDVDAGIVYASDAATEPRVRVVRTFDASRHRPIVYPVAILRRAASSLAARDFYETLTTREALEIFEEVGFIQATPEEGEPITTLASESAPSGIAGPIAVSLIVASCSLLISLAPAVLLGWFLARREFTGKALLSTVFMVPIVLPPVVTGYVLLAVFGRNGLLGPFAETMGLEIAFTRLGAITAAAVVGFPLLILTIRQAIEAVDPRYERLAETLGLHPLAAFWKITLPMAAPGLVAGCVLAFARALGEFGATIMLAGDTPGETRTLALAVYALYQQPGGEAPAAILVWISFGICLVALVVYERLIRAQKRRSLEIAH